jgi:pimeloyl-ACP methyl ester carboxylesterase
MSVFRTGTAQIYYEIHGAGPPVVLGHGLGADRTQPQELAGRLPTHQLMVWDCRGHGETQSRADADQFDFLTLAEDLRALLDHLRVPTAVVGGISMGAGVAIRFAVQWPERVKALILVRPAWLDQPNPPQLRLFVRIAELLDSLGPEKGLAAFERDVELLTLRQTAPAMADSLCRQFTADRAYERRARLKQMPLASPIDHWEQVENLRIPALVIGTRADPLHPYEFAETWAHHLPLAQLFEIPSKSQGVKVHEQAFQGHLARFLSAFAI